MPTCEQCGNEVDVPGGTNAILLPERLKRYLCALCVVAAKHVPPPQSERMF